MVKKPAHVERGGEVRADTKDKWSEDETARQERGLPEKSADRVEDKSMPRAPGKVKDQ